MNHIYIHIPFCLKKCNYCDFCSTTDLSLADNYIKALCDEIEHYVTNLSLRANEVSEAIQLQQGIKTIYFGGGTPSILEPGQLDHILKKLNSTFTIDKNCEITLEANPETIDRKKLLSFKEIGFNRVSIGVQSFIDEDLEYLGRIHSAEKAKKGLKEATKVFDNVSFDLIYGLPGDTIEKLKYNVKQAVGFKPQHISYYELTYEEGTPLYNDMKEMAGTETGHYNNCLPLRSGRSPCRPSEDDLVSQYQTIKQLLKANSYNQYEISNYAQAGFECRHNLAYWSDKSYLGLGTSAHSYDKEEGTRWANTNEIKRYIRGDRRAFKEDAKDIDKLIMGLRKTEGMPINDIAKRYRESIYELLDEGMLMEKGGDVVAFTEKGMLISNYLLLKMMA